MKELMAKLFLGLSGAFVLAGIAMADHSHHVKHGMVLFGEGPIYASHIVYKAPHNFQVILEVVLSADVKKAYLETRRVYPGERLLLVLDPMDLSTIDTREFVTGTVLREDAAGQRVEVVAGVRLNRKEYEIVYFDELDFL